MEEHLLNVEQLADKLQVPKSWVYSSTRQKQIPFLKVGKYCRFRLADVLATLEAKQAEG